MSTIFDDTYPAAPNPKPLDPQFIPCKRPANLSGVISIVCPSITVSPNALPNEIMKPLKTNIIDISSCKYTVDQPIRDEIVAINK